MNNTESVQVNKYVRPFQKPQPTANLELKPYVPSEVTKVHVEPVKMAKEDLEILNYILEMRYLDAHAIVQKFFKEKEEEAEAKVNELMEKGWLKVRTLRKTKQIIYIVSELGRNELVKEQTDKRLAEETRQVFEPRVRHDLMLIDLRIRFEELWYINKWFSEMMLKEVPMFLREFKVLPDAVCRKRDEKQYFLELEVSQKSKKQYQERIAEYQRILDLEEIKSASIEEVIFFCKTKEVQAFIKSLIPKDCKNVSAKLYDSYFWNKRANNEVHAS